MEKKYLSRLGYGFSALVLGLAAFYPAVNTYAAEASVEITASDIVPEADGLESTANMMASESIVETELSESAAVTDMEPVENTDADGTDDESEPNDESEPDEDDDEMDGVLDGDEYGNERLDDGDDEGDGDDDGDIIDVPDIIHNLHYRQDAVKVGESITTNANREVWVYREVDEKITQVACFYNYDDDMEFGEICDELTSENGGVEISVDENGVAKISFSEVGIYEVQVTNFDEETKQFERTNIYVSVIAISGEAAETLYDTLRGISQLNNEWEEAWRAVLEARWSEDEEKIAIAEAALSEKEEGFSLYYQQINRAYGDTWYEIADAIMNGKAISTDVKVEAVSSLDEDVKNALLDQMDTTFSGSVSYYDIDVIIYADDEKIGTLRELTGEQTVVIGGFSAPAAGFKRVFQVVRYHTYAYIDENGEEQVEVEVSVIDDVDFDPATGEISFASDKFSTYAVGYKDVLAASVNTGVFTGEGASATSSAFSTIMVVAVIILLGGAIKFAKTQVR